MNIPNPPQKTSALDHLRGNHYSHFSTLLKALADHILAQGWPQLDRWLRAYLRGQKDFGSRDRAVYSELLFQSVRHMMCIDYMLAQSARNSGGISDPVQWHRGWSSEHALHNLLAQPEATAYAAALRSGAEVRPPIELPKPQAIEKSLESLTTAATECNWDESPHLILYSWTTQNAEWLTLRAEKSDWSAEQCRHFVQVMAQPAPTWLRLQGGVDPKNMTKALAEDGIETRTTDGHVCVVSNKSLYQHPLYKEGKLEIQDLASQQVARIVADLQPDTVWDACAGAGGKTIAIADLLDGRGSITATDIRLHKLQELKRRAKRAQRFNIRSFEWNGAAALELRGRIARDGGFDAVLVDAPCSNSGTWRRNPDAKWRTDAQSVHDVALLAGNLLDNSCHAVRSGGYLVFATCSWLVEENEHQIQKFLDQHPEFSLHNEVILAPPALDSDAMYAAVLHKN